jgi:serine/threonine protein kinase
MADAFIEKFLKDFDDSRFPPEFQQEYEIMECLGHNELGETLLVRDQQSGIQCVAKCYPAQDVDPRTSESSLLRTFHHEGLPVFVDEYHNEKTRCVVRAFVEGTPLDQLARGKPLPAPQAVAILSQLCDILSYLHSQNPPIIHRDIKPQNVIIDEQGKVTLIDFGISRTYDRNAQEDTILFGTRHYAAPEQYGFSQTDPRSDIFSLGILLGWLLTGSVEVGQAIKAIPDRRLAGVVAKCTAFDPRDRFSSAAQVKDALTDRTRRRRSLVMLGAGLLLLGALLTAYLTSGVHFKEPLIEEAARLSLGKETGSSLTDEDLASVQQLYVFGDQAVADRESFNQLVNDLSAAAGRTPRQHRFAGRPEKDEEPAPGDAGLPEH